MGLFDTIKAKLGLGDVSNEAQTKALCRRQTPRTQAPKALP